MQEGSSFALEVEGVGVEGGHCAEFSARLRKAYPGSVSRNGVAKDLVPSLWSEADSLTGDDFIIFGPAEIVNVARSFHM